MASHLRALVVLMTLASVFAVAWHLEVWLIPVVMAATATALVVGEQLGERVLAQRAATLALHVPEGEVEATDLEQAIAADLAANAVSDPEVLDHTAPALSRPSPIPGSGRSPLSASSSPRNWSVVEICPRRPVLSTCWPGVTCGSWPWWRRSVLRSPLPPHETTRFSWCSP